MPNKEDYFVYVCRIPGNMGFIAKISDKFKVNQELELKQFVVYKVALLPETVQDHIPCHWKGLLTGIDPDTVYPEPLRKTKSESMEENEGFIRQ